jgi:hypothetical protein
MITRWWMLLISAGALFAAFAVAAGALQPSAQRLAAAALVAVLAPLLWPGIAAGFAPTALRVVGWSVAAAAVAALLLAAAPPLLGAVQQPPARIAATCAMLLLLLLATHLLAAVFQALRRGAEVRAARERAGHLAGVAVALLGASPLWLGPAGELLSARHPGAVDAVVAASPLTHLAVSSGNDLLRNQWLYQNSNLASLQFAYPEPSGVAAAYLLVCLLLGFALLRLLQPAPPIIPPPSLSEKSP